MKKLFAILLAVAMMATMSVTAFAVTIEGESDTVVITYGVDDSYVVTIPADITLSAGAASTMEISATNVVIGYGEQLTVSISSTNYADSKWYLVDTENPTNKLEYSVKNGETAVASGEAILTVDAGTAETETATLTTALVGTATVSGTYKDTITFTVNVAEAPATEG